MDDVGYIELAQVAVERVEGRYGIIAGWATAALMIIAPFIAIAGFIAVLLHFR
jgi:hypothetical protein